MSKELDALKRFNSDVVVYNEYIYYDRNLIDGELYQKNLESIAKDYDLLKQALKRNDPKEIVIRDTNNGLSMKTVRCGNCDDKILVGYMSDIRSKYSKHKFCKKCGVMLGWGKINEV